jgi:hypothetical protein
MAAEAATSANALHSSIVSDQRVIEFIYRAVKDAGRMAFDIEMMKKLPYYVSPIGSMSRIHDSRSILSEYNNPPLSYISNDITIVGGAALNIYDSKLTGFKQRRSQEFKSLREELSRETTDIDMVWWPRETNRKSGKIYTADSPAIFSFVQSFIGSLYGTLNNLPRGLIPGLNNIEIKPRFIPIIGVHFIEISFLIYNKEYKIADLAIHDNGGSQQYDSSGKEITKLVSMYNDPIYCSSYEGNEYSTTSFRKTKPYVPNPIWYVKQQLFAYGNFSMRGDVNKMSIIQKRIEYLIKILRSYLRNHTNQNKHNLTELFGANTTYDKLVEDIVLLAKEKGMDLEEISEKNIENMAKYSKNMLKQFNENQINHAYENSIKNMAEYSKKTLESRNTNQVKKYREFMGELNNMGKLNKMQQNNSNSLINKYADLMKYFMYLLKKMEDKLEVAKKNKSINTNKSYQLKINVILRVYDTYFPIFNYYNEKGDHYITELSKDPDNKEYKLKFNDLIRELEKYTHRLYIQLVEQIKQIDLVEKLKQLKHASKHDGGTRKRHNYKEKTKKRKSNVKQSE